MNWLKAIGGAIVGPVVGYFTSRGERKTKEKLAKIDADIARMHANKQAISEGRKADVDWELLSIKNSSHKDELWTYWFFGVATATFVPALQPYVRNGIDILGSYPEWFTWAWLSVVLSAFGIRTWRRL